MRAVLPWLLSFILPFAAPAALHADVNPPVTYNYHDDRVMPLGSMVKGFKPQRSVELPALWPIHIWWIKQRDLNYSEQHKNDFQTTYIEGVGRQLPRPLIINSKTVSQNEWITLPSGWRIFSIEVVSKDATKISVHLENLKLKDGVRIILYAPEHIMPATPISTQYFARYKDVALENIPGDHGIIECRVPPGVNTEEISFEVKEISHFYK